MQKKYGVTKAARRYHIYRKFVVYKKLKRYNIARKVLGFKSLDEISSGNMRVYKEKSLIPPLELTKMILNKEAFKIKKIGIIGGGQLGKMMILDAKRMDLYVVTLDPTENCPSHSISDYHIVANFDDAKVIKKLAKIVDVITCEFEHINVEALEEVEKLGYVIYPSTQNLQVI